jgi:hypothetical protein
MKPTPITRSTPLGGELAQPGLAVGAVRRLEPADLDAELAPRALEAAPGGVVERAIVFAADVEHQPDPDRPRRPRRARSRRRRDELPERDQRQVDRDQPSDEVRGSHALTLGPARAQVIRSRSRFLSARGAVGGGPRVTPRRPAR